MLSDLSLAPREPIFTCNQRFGFVWVMKTVKRHGIWCARLLLIRTYRIGSAESIDAYTTNVINQWQTAFQRFPHHTFRTIKGLEDQRALHEDDVDKGEGEEMVGGFLFLHFREMRIPL